MYKVFCRLPDLRHETVDQNGASQDVPEKDKSGTLEEMHAFASKCGQLADLHQILSTFELDLDDGECRSTPLGWEMMFTRTVRCVRLQLVLSYKTEGVWAVGVVCDLLPEGLNASAMIICMPDTKGTGVEWKAYGENLDAALAPRWLRKLFFRPAAAISSDRAYEILAEVAQNVRKIQGGSSNLVSSEAC